MFDSVLPKIHANWHIHTLERYLRNAHRVARQLGDDLHELLRMIEELRENVADREFTQNYIGICGAGSRTRDFVRFLIRS
jgi:hypothetical protein